ncbi:MAG TPA: hypothetical protein VGE01_10320 [Fimbriimonas sp.]
MAMLKQTNLSKKMRLGSALLVLMAMVGCSAGPQKLDEDYLKKAPELGKARYEIMQRAGRDWNNLTPEDKAKFVETFDGDEAQAKAYWENVKAGPPSGPAGMGGPQGVGK